jgi:signal transduction histidine kinase
VATDEARSVILPPDVEAHVFRIVQEALTNVRKHAGAHRAVVRLDADARTLAVSVEDDGRGMPESRAGSADWPHYGLQTMRERAEGIDAELTFEPTSGGGTTVRLMVPLTIGRRVH